MKNHISFQPDRSLRSALRRPGGITAEEAIARAKRNLETIRESSVETLHAQIDSLSALVSSGATVNDIYFTASEIFGIAGTFGLKHIMLAAESLCDLLSNEELPEETKAAAPSRTMLAAINVHVDAFRVLRVLESAPDNSAAEQLIAGLQRVVSHTHTSSAAAAG